MADHGFKLPHIRSHLKFAGKRSKQNKFWDAKFYPYSKDKQVFAAVGQEEIVICRPSEEKINALEILSTIRDIESEDAALNSCTWCKLDDTPLLCVAGINGKIKVFDVLKPKLERTFVGHGSEINDLGTHPLYPHIIVSGSGDNSIRVWSLLPEHRKNPCLLILGHGQAHREGILSCSFHRSGRYLISGGLDHMICVWTLPDLSQDSTESWDGTRVIHYPHFITQAIHSNYVDCVSFYGDLILSKAAEEDVIVLWTITGFTSKLPPPPQETAPVTETFRDTRSGFLKIVQPDTASDGLGIEGEELPPFERLLSLSIPDSVSFYMRFSLLRPSPQEPDLHPMLAFMNTKTKLMVWDFTRLRLGHDGRIQSPDEIDGLRKKKGKTNGKRGLLQHNLGFPEKGNSAFSPSNSSRGESTRDRSESIITDTNLSSSLPPEAPSTSATSVTGFGAAPSVEVGMIPPPPLRRKYNISDPFQEIDAHQISTIQKLPNHMTARQAAWSHDGKWLVVVGEANDDAIIALYQR